MACFCFKNCSFYVEMHIEILNDSCASYYFFVWVVFACRIHRTKPRHNQLCLGKPSFDVQVEFLCRFEDANGICSSHKSMRAR